MMKRLVSLMVPALLAECLFAQETVTSAADDPARALSIRRHEGIPSLAVSPVNGRMWATWYASVTGAEDAGNFVVLSTSADGGCTWREVAHADPDGNGPLRAFDPEVWVSPDGKLRWFWTERVSPVATAGADPYAGAKASAANDRLMMATLDAEREPAELPKAVAIARGIMMCKPITLRNGSWLLPVANWQEDRSSGIVRSDDGGRTFRYVGGASMPKGDREFDEHNIFECGDGRLACWSRAKSGIRMSTSADGGATWSPLESGAVKHTSSRFFVRRLASGALLLVKHGAIDRDVGRQELEAFVSDDDGATWKGGLMLDERKGVSYPDGVQLADGRILVVYDRARMGDREILFCEFKEDDVRAGRNVSGAVRLRRRISSADKANPSKKDAPAVTLADLRRRAEALVAKMTLEEKVSQLMNHSVAIPRLGVPQYNWWSEALHGVARNGRATVFPQPIGMSASFNPELVREVASAIADEGRAKFVSSIAAGRRDQYTGLTFWSPNVNLFRDPRWGRGTETWGEDPYLTGTMGTAFIRGLQGDDPVYLKAAACAKHFAVHSGPENLRHSFDACPSKKDLRETYLPAFEMCVKEGRVEAVMGAYNRVYGESASASKLLLKDILRGEWGFEGHVVSDCGAVCDIWQHHKIVQTPAEAGALAIKNGLTVECGSCFKHLKAAVEQKLVTEAELDAALVRLFTTRYRLGILGNDPACPYGDVDPACICSAKHRELARRIARESMVLLKNDGILPLDPNHGTYAVVGAGATDLFSLMGNYYGVADRYVSYLEGISSGVDAGVGVFYNPGYLYGKDTAGHNYHGWGPIICVVGLTNAYEGEQGESHASEANGDRVTLRLPKGQMDCLRILQDQRKRGRKIITVITGGSPVELGEVEKFSDAVIMAWYGGEEGGTALADLVFGRADFTGRLPLTFPDSADVLPPFEDYAMAGRTYRYQTKGVTHAFGYGLSYARFEGRVASTAKKGECEQVAVAVRNAADRPGVAVVQLYVSTPNAGKGAPIKSLVGFRRVPLKAGEEKSVSFDVAAKQLMEFGEDGVPRRVPGDCTYSVQF